MGVSHFGRGEADAEAPTEGFAPPPRLDLFFQDQEPICPIATAIRGPATQRRSGVWRAASRRPGPQHCDMAALVERAMEPLSDRLSWRHVDCERRVVDVIVSPVYAELEPLPRKPRPKLLHRVVRSTVAVQSDEVTCLTECNGGDFFYALVWNSGDVLSLR